MAVADTNYRFVYVDIGNVRKRLILTFLKDLRYGYQFRQTRWNYPVRNVLQEQKVHVYNASL